MRDSSGSPCPQAVKEELRAKAGVISLGLSGFRDLHMRQCSRIGRLTWEQVSHCQSGWSSRASGSGDTAFSPKSASELRGGARGATAGVGVVAIRWLEP
jgi:hypothetical protein